MILDDIQALDFVPARRFSNIGSHLLTTSRYPFLYQRITKCGCTYLRHLVWDMEHGIQPPVDLGQEAVRYPEPTAMLLSNQEVRAATHKFVVIRHPVRRFMSLYYDKILGSPKPMGPFVDRLGIDHHAGQNIESHRRNCVKALNFISRQRRNRSMSKVNWHWKPQYVRLGQLRGYGFSALQLENLGTQLTDYLQDLVPDIKQRMQAIKVRNISRKPVQPQEILTDGLIDRIQNIYRADWKIWQEVNDFWQAQK